MQPAGWLLLSSALPWGAAPAVPRSFSPNKALLQLSFRYLSDDHFWFTFFHEAGHLILHSKSALFLEGAKNVDACELEANEFAARILVPSEFQKRLQDLPIDRHEIQTLQSLSVYLRGLSLDSCSILAEQVETR